MNDFGWVLNSDTTQVRRRDLDDRPLRSGLTNVRLPAQTGGGELLISRMSDNAQPRNGIYLLTPGTECSPSDHYLPSYSYAFSGTVGQTSARVVETITCNEIAIGDLYNLRKQELDALYAQVYNQGVTVNLVGGSGTRALRTTQESFANYVSIGSSKLPASTDYTIFDLWGAPFLMRKNDWDEIATGLALHYTQTNANRQMHDDNMQGLRDTPDFAGLSAYDITTGWPAAPVQP